MADTPSMAAGGGGDAAAATLDAAAKVAAAAGAAAEAAGAAAEAVKAAAEAVVAAAASGGCGAAATTSGTKAGMFRTKLGKPKTINAEAIQKQKKEEESQRKRDILRKTELENVKSNVIRYVSEKKMQNADAGGKVNWTKKAANNVSAPAAGGGGGAAAAGGGGGAAAAGGGGAATKPGEDIYNHKGAMIFFINKDNHVLYGQESKFLIEQNASELEFPVIGEHIINVNNWYDQLILSKAYKNYILPIYTNENTKLSEIENLDQNELPILIPLDWDKSKRQSKNKNNYIYEMHLRKKVIFRGHPVYSVPKGGKKERENAYQTIMREVWEEVGVDLRDLPAGRLQLSTAKTTKSNYVIYYLTIDESEQEQIERIIRERSDNNLGEMYQLSFLAKPTYLNDATKEAYDFLIKNSGVTLLGGKRRRITHKRSKRSKRTTKKTARRTRRR